MNLIDALKSGKRFRKKDHPYWLADDIPNSAARFSFDDVLADWEIEPDKPREFWAVDTGVSIMLYETQPAVMSNSWKLFRVREVIGE